MTAPARICIVTAGALSSCPRVVKAADALHEAGHLVRVVSTSAVGWNREADLDLVARRSWRWRVIRLDWETARATRLWSGLRQRLAGLAPGPALDAAPLALAARAFGRTYPELVRAVLEEPTDLVYAGTSGGLAVARAAGRAGRRYALDLEDLYGAERADGPGARRHQRLAGALLRAALPGARALTAAGAAVAEAYRTRYGVAPVVVNNTFPLPAQSPDPEPGSGPGLRLHWFSQTIGPDRGLEEAVRALGLAELPGELDLRGVAIPGYMEALQALARRVAPRLEVRSLPPLPPDQLVAACRPYDAGLAVEPGGSLNNRLALSNKAFTYVLAGLAVVLTDTPGQRALAADLGPGALTFAPGDVEALAAGLRRWAEDRALLAKARAAAWDAARRRWHWEHPAERGALLGALHRALGA